MSEDGSYHSSTQSNFFISEATLDDAMRRVIQALRSSGEPIQPDKGSATELLGAMIEIRNPRARVSRTETRGKLFSCLGELCWYLSGSNHADFIKYYLPLYENYAEGDVVSGGYGPRIVHQMPNVIALLQSRPDSRRAVIQLLDAEDLREEGTQKNVPCTCFFQFLLRRGGLHMFTCMRSNDAFLGLPHDIFSFTMIQEIVARRLSAKLGTYKHAVGSLHLYKEHESAAQTFLSEGWQSTEIAMPVMPDSDLETSIEILLSAESKIRNGEQFDSAELDSVDPYWADLIRVLLFLSYKRSGFSSGMASICRELASPIYRSYLQHQMDQPS